MKQISLSKFVPTPLLAEKILLKTKTLKDETLIQLIAVPVKHEAPKYQIVCNGLIMSTKYTIKTALIRFEEEVKNPKNRYPQKAAQ